MYSIQTTCTSILDASDDDEALHCYCLVVVAAAVDAAVVLRVSDDWQ